MKTLENIPNSDSISVKKDGKVNLMVKCAIIKKDNLLIGFIPSLKLTARSLNGEVELHEHLDKIITSFFKHYNNISKLDKELKRLGWKKEVSDRDLTDKEGVFLSPESVSMPYDLLNGEVTFEPEEKQLVLQS